MSNAAKHPKVTSWSLNLYLSDGTKVEATNLPNFTSAAIDDYCTDIDTGKITSDDYQMKMTESGYYYKQENHESWKNEPLLGHGIGFQDMPLSTPGAYSATSGSGDATLGEPGAAGFGTIRAGARERSNVDLTAELVDLITAQRNFQANAKAIETSSSLTQTIINIRG